MAAEGTYPALHGAVEPPDSDRNRRRDTLTPSDNGTPAARPVRKATGLAQAAELPKKVDTGRWPEGATVYGFTMKIRRIRSERREALPNPGRQGVVARLPDVTIPAKPDRSIISFPAGAR
jgi:hypothetical protein